MALCEAAELVAVASRSREKAAAWAAEHAPPDVRVYGSYDELLSDASVDAVYLPLPTTLHAEWVLKVAAAGKHVLVEKPVGRDVAEVEAMLDACQDRGVMFMDGVMFMHHLRLQKLQAQIWGPGSTFGQPTLITAGFSFKGDDAFLEGGNIRTQASGDPLGCLGDLGWYCIRFGLCCHGYRWPSKALCISMEHNAAGVPVETVAEIHWENPENPKRAFVLHFQTSFLHPFRQHVEVCGDGSTLHLDDFVISHPHDAAFVRRVTGLMDFDVRPTVHEERYSTTDWAQEVAMFDTFAREASASRTDLAQPSFWGYVTAVTQACCDAVRQSSDMGGELVDVPTMERFAGGDPRKS